jgi:hypothetical protein
MEEVGPLGELINNQRPGRRNDKTYGKKKAFTAESRAMHFDLFVRGRDENDPGHQVQQRKAEEEISNRMRELEVADLGREIETHSVLEPSTASRQIALDHDPRVRGRRIPTSQKKLAVQLSIETGPS